MLTFTVCSKLEDYVALYIVWQSPNTAVLNAKCYSKAGVIAMQHSFKDE